MAKMTKGVGTPQYMAPEILEGCQSYEYAKACDVYSYSILLLETWEVKDVFGASGMSHFEICQFVIDGKVQVCSWLDVIYLWFVCLFVITEA